LSKTHSHRIMRILNTHQPLFCDFPNQYKRYVPMTTAVFTESTTKMENEIELHAKKKKKKKLTWYFALYYRTFLRLTHISSWSFLS
jgi:hypothetical protein